MIKSGIYKIIDCTNNRLYVGSAVYFYRRFHVHKSLLSNNKHFNKHLQHSWNKYGECNFKFEIIEYCEKEKLLEREQYWIDSLNCIAPNGYNLTPIAGSRLGSKHTEETKAKMRKPKSENSKINISLARRGKKLTEEHKLKMSIAKKGKEPNNRNKNKWPHSLGYNCRCEECLNKKSEYNKNRKFKNEITYIMVP